MCVLAAAADGVPFIAGVALMRQQKYAAAISIFEKAVDADPSQPYVWSNLACAYSGMGRLHDTARAFK